MKMIEGGVTAAQGFVAGGIHCGVRKNKSKPDLAMIYSEKPCAAAAVYTQNLVKGAPILVTQKNIADGAAKAVICNSGNANTCNADGEEKLHRRHRPGAAHRAHPGGHPGAGKGPERRRLPRRGHRHYDH